MGNMNVTVIDQNNVKIAVTPTPIQTISIDRGLIGPQGISGISGYSGYSGYSGISGYSGSGISGYSGYSGQQGTSINVKGEVPTVGDLPPTGNQVNDAYIVTADGDLWIWDGSAWFDAGQIVGPQGFSGFSGYSGFSGMSGYSGFSGISGYSGSGVSGWSGDSGISGFSGWSGESGYSGISGFSGDSGISGFSGDSGISGYSGYSGISGFSGSGISGWSGESGYSGYSGISGYSGYSGEVGTSGISGFSGYSGAVGESGYSGISGYSGFSGISGQDGASGTSGYSGASGFSGISGWSGISGYSGFSGISGYSGAVGLSSSLFTYYAEAVQTSGQPASGYLLWNTATQSNATQININHLTNDGSDIDIFLALLQPTQKFTIQDQNVSANYQSWLITGTTTNINAGTGNSYWTVPVSLISSGGTGTTDFADNHPLFLAITAGVSGTSGFSGISGWSGISGASGISGWSGISGYSGASGISGENGASGYSGTSGYSGYSGISGQDGASGYSGISGASGFSGISGYSGYSGIDGASGYSGISGYSGSGVSGYSGFSGISGYSGYSGITPTIGGSNTQVQYNNSGVLGGSSGLTWDGTYLSSTGGINFSGYTSSALTGGYGVRSLAGLGTQVVSSYRIGLSINGGTSDALTVINSGGVSIGTTADAGANNLTVNGLVGIGISNPDVPLTIKGGTNTAIKIIQDSGTGTTATLYGGANTGVRYGTLTLNRSDTSAITTLISGDSSGDSYFCTKVGIGNSSPSYALDVTGQIRASSGASASALIATSTNSGGTALNIQNSGTVNALIGGYLSCIGSGSATDVAIAAYQGALAFATNGANVRMRIDSSGNVGIGTTPSPFSAGRTVLEIGGSTTGNIAFNGNATNGYQVWCNSYFNSGNFYYANGYATNFGSGNGTFFWNLAPNNTSGAGAVATFTQAMTLNANGNLLVGTTNDLIWTSSSLTGCVIGGNASTGGYSSIQISRNADALLLLNRLGNDGDLVVFARQGTGVGSISATTTLTSYNVTSDYRLKENIAPMTGALAKVAQLNPVTYKWKVNGSDGQGFIAHELQAVVPDCVTGEKDAVDKDGKPVYQGMDTSHLVATLVSAIQELKAEIDLLKQQINGV